MMGGRGVLATLTRPIIGYVGASDVNQHTPEDRMPQPLRGAVRGVLLRCVDMAETGSDQKSMLITMYESGLLSCAETFAHIAIRKLENQ